jgi:hypothetical protein
MRFLFKESFSLLETIFLCNAAAYLAIHEKTVMNISIIAISFSGVVIINKIMQSAFNNETA